MGGFHLDAYSYPDNPEVYARAVALDKPGLSEVELKEARIYQLKKDLKSGDSGEEVRFLQKKLYLLNYYSGPITGYFGSATKTALANYRTDKGLAKTPTQVDKSVRDLLNNM